MDNKLLNDMINAGNNLKQIVQKLGNTEMKDIVQTWASNPLSQSIVKNISDVASLKDSVKHIKDSPVLQGVIKTVDDAPQIKNVLQNKASPNALQEIDVDTEQFSNVEESGNLTKKMFVQPQGEVSLPSIDNDMSSNTKKMTLFEFRALLARDQQPWYLRSPM
jgi:hypothetical protein